MPNVVVLVKDDRVRRQIEQYLNELGMDDLRYSTFKSTQEFSHLYFRDRVEEEPKSEAEGEATETKEDDGADLKLFSEVHLMIVALDNIEGKVDPWLQQFHTAAKKYKFWPQDYRIRMILMKYEDDGVTKLELVNPHLDDVIYMPLDRLIFLQKVQIIINLPKKTTPTYLFSQEVKHKIEVSKISKLDRLSDVALAIRNPVPLKPGLIGRFYVTFPEERTPLHLTGKVIRSVQHPDHPDQYLVYFTYLGISKADLTTIRRSLSKAPRYHSLLDEDRNHFRFNPEDLFNTGEDSLVFGVGLVESDDTVGKSLAQSISKDIDRINVSFEKSLGMFIYEHMDSKSEDRTPPDISTETEFYSQPLTIRIAKDMKFIDIQPLPEEGQTFLGHDMLELIKVPDGPMSLIADKLSRAKLEESMLLVDLGKNPELALIFQSKEQNRMAVSAKMSKAEGEGQYRIELSPAGLDVIMTHFSSAKSGAKRLDIIILDGPFLPHDPTPLLQGLAERAQMSGLIPTVESLSVFGLLESERSLPEGWVNHPMIKGIFTKPIDTRHLYFLLSEYLKNKNTLFHFENLGWSSPNLSIHTAKSIELESLSEFGATLKSQQRIAAGTIFFLRKSIYNNAPNQCLAARVYACDEHPTESGFFQILCTYFGINDAFLKFARTWIRENYASQKGGDN